MIHLAAVQRRVFPPTRQLLFQAVAPTTPNQTDGVAYELGLKFQSSIPGRIIAIRHFKAASETGSHTGRIWLSSTMTQLTSVAFTNESASGWQEQTLDTPLLISANTTYAVSVNINSNFAVTLNALGLVQTVGNLSTIADGSNGFYNLVPGLYPMQSSQNSNYFRDIVFVAS